MLESGGLRATMNLTLLGRTELVDSIGSVVHLPTKKVFLLLALLATNPGDSLNRSFLVETIWPNSKTDAGRTSLRNALAAIRKVLPTESLITSGDLISLTIDAILCDANADQKPEVEYPGDFMPSFSEDWVLDRRLQIRKKSIQIRLEKAILLVEENCAGEALKLVDAACQIDPLDQDAAQLRLTMLEEQGNFSEAAQSANTFQARVLRELGVLVNLDTTPINTETNPLTVTCDWLVERNPEEAASFLVGTRASWMAMGGRTALQCHKRVLDAYANNTPTRTLVEAQHLYLRWITGEFESSQRETQTAFSKAIANDELEAATILGTALSFGFLSQGRFKESVRHCQLVRQIALGAGKPLEIVKADRNLAIIEQHLGRDGVWENRIRSSSKTVEESGAPDEMAQQNLTMSLVLLREGKLDHASNCLAHARRYFEATSGRRMVGFCLLAQAMIQEETGDFLGAICTVEEIRSFGSDVIGHYLEAACNDIFARLHGRIGEFDFSAESVARASLVRRRFGSTPSIYEINQLNPTRRLLKEQLSEQDLRAAYHRAKLSAPTILS
jgi:DNA-binding SARP family transcriptional activator